MVVDIGGVRQGVSELLPAVKALICCGLNLNFGFSNFGGTGAHMVVGIDGIRYSFSELIQAVYTKP